MDYTSNRRRDCQPVASDDVTGRVSTDDDDDVTSLFIVICNSITSSDLTVTNAEVCVYRVSP